MPPIRIQGLTKAYKDGPLAVDHVDLEIGDGEFMVLVGPSGCGKSTLLQMLAGIVEATEGSIHIGDEDITRLDPRKRDIAMVFQSYALYPHLSVRGNLGFGLKLRKTNKAAIAERVEEVARILGLDELLERKPGELSGGQRQRVAMGRAIVREPKRVPDGRAALQPGREAARLDARPARAAARAARDHDRLRDPRPGRGDDAGRPGGGAAQGRAPAVRHPAVAVRAAREPVRGRLHRLARHEPRRGGGPRRRGALRQLPARHRVGRVGAGDPRAPAARPHAGRAERRPVVAAAQRPHRAGRGAGHRDAAGGRDRRAAAASGGGPGRARRRARRRRPAGRRRPRDAHRGRRAAQPPRDGRARSSWPSTPRGCTSSIRRRAPRSNATAPPRPSTRSHDHPDPSGPRARTRRSATRATASPSATARPRSRPTPTPAASTPSRRWRGSAPSATSRSPTARATRGAASCSTSRGTSSASRTSAG